MENRSIGRIIRVVLLFVGIALSWCFSHSGIEKVRHEYQTVKVGFVQKGLEHEAYRTIGEQEVKPGESFGDWKSLHEAYKAAAGEVLKQSQSFQGWGALLLAGIVTILITTKVHRVPRISWLYLVLAPAGVFLLHSLYAGWILAKRYTYLVAQNNYSNLVSLETLFEQQATLFLYALICVSAFAAWFLVLIVVGRAEPFESST